MSLSFSRPQWRKSSYSGHNGNCVEVAALGCQSGEDDGMASQDRTPLDWRKSSHSNAGGECVEVAAPRRVLIRDSKAPDAPYVITTAQGWHSLMDAVKRGSFDL